MTETAIRVENLGKRYVLGQSRDSSRQKTFRETVTDAISRPFQRTTAPPSADEFWALQNVSFEIKRGEVVGIIGRNGAGKSTLLKILSRITDPTEGRITIKGRVASLLEVGTGFHAELTGRENIYLNGAILGMSRVEIKAKFDEIVAFAEVEKFLDTPVKRYSSGMYVRLAFAVAAHLEPEILIVDEVLAVGDTEFQKKCLGRMDAVSKQGRTVLFVSHNMGAILQLCTRGIVLEAGKVKLSATAAEASRLYLSALVGSKEIGRSVFLGPLAGTVQFTALRIDGQTAEKSTVVSPASPIRFVIEGSSPQPLPSFRITFSIYREGVRLLTMHDVEVPTLLEAGNFESRFEVPPFFLRPGDYSVAIGGYRDGMNEWLWATDLLSFSVLEEWSQKYDPINIGWVNIVEYGQRIHRNT